MMERVAGPTRSHADGTPTAGQTRQQLLHRCCGCQQSLGGVRARLMPCFHVLCEPCLALQAPRVSANDPTALCPACKRTWRLQDLSEFLLAEVAGTAPAIRCQMNGCPEKAEKAVAVATCDQCVESLCQGCTDAHRRVTATANHRLRDLPISRSDAGRRCRWHPTEKIAYLCKCDNFICEFCPTTSEHMGIHHDQRYPIHALMARSKTECGQIVNQNKHELSNLARSEQMVCKRIEDLKAAREVAKNQVGEEICRLTKFFMQRGERLCQQIDEASAKKQREYEQLRGDLTERHRMYQRAQSLAEEIAACEHPIAVIRSKRHLNDYVNRISNITNFHHQFNGLQLQPHLKFNSSTTRLEDAITAWGQVLLDYIPIAEQQQQQGAAVRPQLPQQQTQLPQQHAQQTQLSQQHAQMHPMYQTRPAAPSQQHFVQQMQYQQQQQQFSPRLPVGSPIRSPMHSPTGIQQQSQMSGANGQMGQRMIAPSGHPGVAYPPRPMNSPGSAAAQHSQGAAVFQFNPPPQQTVSHAQTVGHSGTLAQQLQRISAAPPPYSSPTVGQTQAQASYQQSRIQRLPNPVGPVMNAGSLLSQQLRAPAVTGPGMVTVPARAIAPRPTSQLLGQLAPPPLICARPQMQPALQQQLMCPPVVTAPLHDRHPELRNIQPLVVSTQTTTSSESTSAAPVAPAQSTQPPVSAVSRSPSISPVGLSGAPIKKTARKTIRPPISSRPARTLEDICAGLAKSHEDPPPTEQTALVEQKPNDTVAQSTPAVPQVVDSTEQKIVVDQAVVRKKESSSSPAPAPIRVVLRKSEGGYASTSTPPPPLPVPLVHPQVQEPSAQERTTPDASLVTTTRVNVQDRDDSSWDDYCFVCEQGCDAETGESLGCCAKCPRVFHNTCHIPRIKQRMEELPDTWTCTLCQPFDPLLVETDNDSNELTPMQRLMCEKVLLMCFSKGTKAAPFNHPVETKIITDYRKVIRKPMDFSIIAKRLRPKLPNRLRSVDKFIELMNLVFKNCSVYNPPDAAVAEAGRLVFQDYCNGVKQFMPSKSHLVWQYATLYKERNTTADCSASTDGEVHTDDDDDGPGPSKRKRLAFGHDQNANEEFA